MEYHFDFLSDLYPCMPDTTDSPQGIANVIRRVIWLV